MSFNINNQTNPTNPTNPTNLFANSQPTGIFANQNKSSKPNLFSNPLFVPNNPNTSPLFTGGKPQQKKGLFDNLNNPKTGNINSFQFPKNEQNPTIKGAPSLFGMLQPASSNTANTNQITQLKKDNQLQKQMLEHTLKRIKQLQAYNTQLQTKNKQLTQKNTLLQTQLLKYQQYFQNQSVGKMYSTPLNKIIQAKDQQKNLTLKQKIDQIPNPINFLNKKSFQLFPGSHAVSIFDQDEIYPNAFTQKTFITTEGYAFQAYIAFNAFYAVKYIILQKLKNNFGYLNLTQSTADQLIKQGKQKRNKNWYLFHQNMASNVISREAAQQLGKVAVQQMKQNKNDPININLQLTKFIQIKQYQMNVYHSDWFGKVPFQLQFYNYLNYSSSSQEVKLTIKQVIQKWIVQKTKQLEKQNQNANKVIWFDDKNGNLHICWQ